MEEEEEEKGGRPRARAAYIARENATTTQQTPSRFSPFPSPFQIKTGIFFEQSEKYVDLDF